ncbi:MAG: single-stranded-DNA-specific exonuclease RecJ [Candidatus Lambdaproteobacteria bacterium]|nr:single-stranded-DNA-specific exonuclease RecJ [Candidatus Lambdaproteobacteria bacterium]
MDALAPSPRRSFGGRTWIDPTHGHGEQSIREISRVLNISEGFGQVLAARGLMDPTEARRFLNPGPEQMHDPACMLGVRPAVLRIHRALEQHESILIFGDYDVDGVASTAILYSYLKRLGARVYYFIPDRLEDGYSLTPQAIEKIRNWGVELVITVDHGSTSVEGALTLRREGIDLIITDHHRLGHDRPAAMALVNPQQEDCAYPFADLAAAGVAYKLLCALDRHLTSINYWDTRGICHTAPDYYLDLVALATVADMAPLLGENRILVKLGLDLMNTKPRPWLAGLTKEANIRCAIAPSTINFKIAPKINALGRVGDPRLGVQFLLTHSFTEARRIARVMLEVNRQRQVLEQEVLALATAQLEECAEHPACVLMGENWHPGVIGSIAARIANQTGKPTVVLTQYRSPLVSGSARAHDRYSVLGALSGCADLLERYGGHPTACGLAMRPENLHDFTRRFNGIVEADRGADGGTGFDTLRLDAWIRPDAMSLQFVREITQLSPFGSRNPEPLLGIRGFSVANPSIFNNRHLRFNVSCPNGHSIDAFAWDQCQWELKLSQRYDIAFMPQLYEGPHGTRIQMKVLDLIPAV